MSIYSPIGIFDSGVGGLTVAKQVCAKLPQESIAYVGDEIHMPYGERSPEEIQDFALGITRFLIEQHCAKAVIMACNMSSALALRPARESFPGVPILGVLEAGARAAVRASTDGKIGILATQGTVNTGAYTRALLSLFAEADVLEQPCPRFVPLVEDGKFESQEAEEAAIEYLRPLLSRGYRTIVLGCTHYPFLSDVIRRITGSDVELIDPAEETAVEMRGILSAAGLANPPHAEPLHRYFTTARPEQFSTLGGDFLRRPIDQVEKITWGLDLGVSEWLEKTVERTTKSVL